MIFEGTDSERIADALNLRERIFVASGHVRIEDDLDGLDTESCHGVLYRGDRAVGVVRMRDLDDDWTKVERVGVLREYRDKGLGAQLMNLVEAKVRNDGKRITLNAHAGAVGFYAARGYEPEGEPFAEAGSMQQQMTKQL